MHTVSKVDWRNQEPTPQTPEGTLRIQTANCRMWFTTGHKDKEIGSGYKFECRNGNFIKWWWDRTQGGFWTVQLTDHKGNQIGAAEIQYTKLETSREIVKFLIDNSGEE